MKEGCFMAFTKYGKLIDVTLTAAGIVIPLITKMRNDKKAEEELVKKLADGLDKRVAEEVAKQMAHRIK
jgi:hypothetical protein